MQLGQFAQLVTHGAQCFGLGAVTQRQQLIQQALTRLPFPKIRQLWQLMARLDHAQRHFDTEQAWLMLQTIALGFRDGTPLPLLETESC